ncbi:MAG: phosphatidylserine/phosphatidylglycerophosphate/cardiolipin synthase family protein, partial [Candidatus Sericytochromatia bacterium]|nr:phosphatidylserine/phosphatidylglycerophosphate/cardiolipin synthase family protein [Candidatus Tanganyikabacteria bacterium]
LKLHVDNPAGYDALEAAINAARRSIWFETFMWHNDASGQRFAKLLARRKLDGLDVRVLVDPLGTSSDRDVLRPMLDAQVPVRFYRQRVLGSLENITHRKLYLMDGWRGFTGGMNIGDPYLHWHDLLVDVQGPAARDMHRVFSEDWNVSGAPDIDVDKAPALQSRYGVSKVRPLKTDMSGDHDGRDLIAAQLAAFKSARKSIRTAQLFLSDDEVLDHLEIAARRGVETKVLVSERNNMGVFRELNKHNAARLRKAGVQFRFYHDRTSHMKYVSVDGAWLMLGSANGDTRSYQTNQEFSLGISDLDFVAEADRRVFDADFAASRIPSDAELKVSWTKKPVVLLADWLSILL